MLRRFVTIPSLATTPSFVISSLAKNTRFVTTTTAEDENDKDIEMEKKIVRLYNSLGRTTARWKNHHSMIPSERRNLAKKQAILRNMIAKCELEYYGQVFIEESKQQRKRRRQSEEKKKLLDEEKAKKKLENMNNKPKNLEAEPKQSEKKEDSTSCLNNKKVGNF